MSGPFHLLMLLLSGGFAAGVAVHANAMRRTAHREAHALLLAICALASIYLFIEARQWLNDDPLVFGRWRHVQILFTGTFMALYPYFVARATGSDGRAALRFFGLGGALLIIASQCCESGRPWIPHVERMLEVTLPWGEIIHMPSGKPNAAILVFVPLWLLVACYGIWRALRTWRDARVQGAATLLASNIFFFIAMFNDGLIDAHLWCSVYLTELIPPALTAGIWWHLSLADRRREESFRDLFEQSADAILVHDAASGRVVEANEAACALFRGRHPMLIGAGLDQLIPPLAGITQGELALRVQELRAGGSAIRERTLRRFDGEEFPGEVALRVATLEGRERIIASFRDLGDRIRAQCAQVENERRLRTVIARCPIAIVEAELDGRVAAMNPRFTSAFGLGAGDDLTLAALRAEGEPPEAALATWRGRIAGALAGDGVLPSVRARIDDREGRRRRVDVCGAIGSDRAMLFVTDLTEALDARDEIARREAFYRVLVEAAADGICVLVGGGSEPAVAVWNPRMATITGVSAADARPPGWTMRLSPDPGAVARFRALLRDARESPLHDVEWELPRHDGSLRTCNLATVELPQELGDRRMLVIVRDVTERKRAEHDRRRADAQVQHTQKLESLGILAGGIAHDFNNLLMAVLGRAGLMDARLGPEHAARHHLLDLERASRRAAELCQQLLAYAGQGRTRIGAVELRGLVEETARVLSVSLPPSARLSSDLGRQPLQVRGDANQLRRVVMNLITNAAEAIGDRAGEVKLRLEPRRLDQALAIGPDISLPPGGYVVLEVADDGCGMDEVTRRRMFEPFFTTKPMGRGLGMAAVLGIIRSHGGGMEVETAVGRGTIVRVLLPSVREDATEATPVPPAPVLPAGGTILVVDDEDAIRRTTRDMLAHLGFSVLEAASGEEALQRFARARGQVRAVVLDLTMPGLDGEETFRRLRELDPRVPVILASGYTRDAIGSSFGGAGIAGFLQKPYDVDALAAALAQALA